MHINVEKPRLSGKNKVNLRHNLFVDYYLSDPERNGLRAYQKVYPNCSYNTANSNSSQLLAKTSIKELIEQKNQELQSKIKDSSIFTREKIMLDIERISQKAEDKEQFSPALKGKELIGKELGMFIDKQVNLNMSLEDLIKQVAETNNV